MDEENRLQAIDDNGFVSNYWYDAAGERTVKTSGESQQVYVNSVFSGGDTQTANFTAYVNPYLVVSKGGQYTKHIYIGSQRIVSKLGDLDSYGSDPRRIEYAGANVDGAKVDYATKYDALQQTIKDRYAAFEVPYYGKDNDDYVNGQGFCCEDSKTLKSFSATGNDNPELFQYYYHSDHLGSSSLITNLDGEIVQHIEYVPFGEVFIEERNNTWNTPYLFNAKELDEETGLYYYGARYYDPRTSVWLSADPLAETYPSISSYAYCIQNPVKFIDPDGKDWDVVINHEKKTITIVGNFKTYRQGTPLNTLNKAISNWNSQSGKFLYVIGEGDDAISYSVDFFIVNSSFANTTMAQNEMQVLPDNNRLFRRTENPDGTATTAEGISDGTIFAVKESRERDRKAMAHEIGHNLGMKDKAGGLMEGDLQSSNELTLKSIGEILNGSGIRNTEASNYNTSAKLKSTRIIGTAPDNFQGGKVIENTEWDGRNF